MYLKYLYLHIYLHYKLRSSAVTDKLLSVSLKVMSLHLSAFVNFVNMFIKYWSRHHTLELSVMANEMVSNMFFFHLKKLLLQNDNLNNKSHKCLLKAYTLHT